MTKMKIYFFSIVFITTILFASSFTTGYAQSKIYPVLLIHGYNSTAAVWEEHWDKLLTTDGIPHKAVTFSANDKCGSAKDHATQLKQIVAGYKKDTNADKINIVAHSKGGRYQGLPN